MGVLLGAGEGAGPVEQSEGARVESTGAGSICTSRYLLAFFNATYTATLGEEVCECGHMPAFSGETTPYWLYWYHEPCDGLAADFVSRIE
ncbi:hypothetical protein MFUL124B02_28870 [Myxococcus fulvus 124B02]|nr:hypothetical protein MFUL124B02_28870 [Myxococcus fulvus 124B02]